MDNYHSEEELRDLLLYAYDLDEETVAALSKDEMREMIKSLSLSMSVPTANDETMEVQSPVPGVQHQNHLTSVVLPPPPSSGSDDRDAPAVPMAQSDSEEAIITEFCDCTGSDRETARHLLEAVGFELESAIPLFFGPESPHRAAPAVRPSTATASATSDSDTPHQNMMNALDGMVQHIDGGTSDFTQIHSSIRQMMQNPTMHHRNVMHSNEGSDDEDESMYHNYMNGMAGRQPRVDQYDEDGIRLPDRAQTRQLVHHNFRDDADDVLARAEDPTIEWMFPTPRHLSYMGSLDQARELGRNENRWVLVNIQSHQEFTSQLLNRDVWTNDTIESMFRTSYLFWQRGHTTRDGKDYMMMHKIKEDDLPHIGFIDPRTGAKLMTLTGLVEANDLAVRMIEFLDSHPLTCTPPPPPSTSSSVPSPASFNDVTTNNTTNSKLPGSEVASVDSRGTSARTETSSSTVGIAGLSNESKIEYKEDAKEVVRNDFGNVPNEPQDSSDAIKVSIKLIDGKQIVRRYLKTDQVSSLFAVVLSTVPEATHRQFDLMTRYPVTSLREKLNQTIVECDLANSQVMMKWL